MLKENPEYRKIPKVDALLNHEAVFQSSGLSPRIKTLLVRKVLQEAREKMGKGEVTEATFLKAILKSFEKTKKRSLEQAINATGVVLHTNLGRAPIGKDSLESMVKALSGYCTLEVDLEKNTRGSRTKHVEDLLCLLTEAESAAVVNNNAAAVFLILQAIAKKKEVLISRGEIVQIGGGFRIHEILEESGAKLVEVGTTNMTKVKDYEKKTSKETACLLKVHQSNFLITGHTESAPLESLKTLAAKKKIPLIVDLGSGGLKRRAEGDPDVGSLVKAGVDLICFSGDKLLGASQAGIIVGKKAWVQKIKTSPLYRALRLSKVDLFLLEETLLKHLKNEKTVTDELVEMSSEEIKKRAELFSKKLFSLSVPSAVVSGTSSIGGGTTPQEQLPTWLVEIPVEDSEIASRKLTSFSPPIFVRKKKKKILLDFRTVFLEDNETLLLGLKCLF